jgi:uncharacterized protein (DUF2141 family)
MKAYVMGLFLILALQPSPLVSQGVQLATLHVVVEGIKSSKGQVKIGLEKSAEDFDKGPLHEARYRGETVVSKEGRIEVHFRDVPFGTYAVKSFHDADGNGQLNTNFMGIPAEDYGFSNNARGTMGPASFKDASFEIDAPEKTITIRLK